MHLYYFDTVFTLRAIERQLVEIGTRAADTTRAPAGRVLWGRPPNHGRGVDPSGWPKSPPLARFAG